MLVITCSDPRGPRSASTPTDLDVQMACYFEMYGRGEITRRARLRASQEEERKAAEKAAKKQASTGGDPARRRGAACSTTPTRTATTRDVDQHGPANRGRHRIHRQRRRRRHDSDNEMDAMDLNDLEDEDELDSERADQKVLATKRKRSGKGMANASARRVRRHAVVVQGAEVPAQVCAGDARFQHKEQRNQCCAVYARGANRGQA